MPKVLITGGTGLVGKHLSKRLLEKGYEVAILSRRRQETEEVHTYTWNPEKNEIDKEALDTADFIIHLAGVDIGAKRWTAERRQSIVDSRIKTGEIIFSSIEKQGSKPKAFITASAIGYYGAISSDTVFSEEDKPAEDFLGQTCQQWEQMADQFAHLGIRTVKIRTGVVLTKEGGALAKMLMPIKMGVGATMGKGKQYFPWIHIEDLCGIYIKAIEDTSMHGAFNAVAPEHHTNGEFTKALVHAFGKRIWFPKIPAIFMKLLFGKMSLLLLKGSRISAKKIINAGYKFQFPNLEGALQHLILRSTRLHK